jgi:transcriptional regulator with XRE-family HTH domain
MNFDHHRRLRKQRGLTQARFAAQIGIHPNTIIDYEAGRLTNLETRIEAALTAQDQPIVAPIRTTTGRRQRKIMTTITDRRNDQ